MRQNVSNLISSSSFFRKKTFLAFFCDEEEELIRENFDQYLVSRIRTKNNLNVFVAHTHHLNLSWKIAPLQVNRKQITLLDLQSIWLKRAVGYNTETIILGNNIFHHLKTYKPVLNNKGKKAPFFYINGHNNNNSKCIIASGEAVDAFKKWINVV